MYIVYFPVPNRAYAYKTLKQAREFTANRPSFSRWMVPGTVSPLED